MKRKRRSTSSQKIIPFFGYFPAELLSEILARLPVKSLLRFRCVSSTFRNAIDSPSFMYKHLNRYIHNNNHEKLDLLTLERPTPQQIIFTTRGRNTFGRISAQHMIISEPDCWPRASVDGLILLLCKTTSRLQLCNLSIRRILKIPPCFLNLTGKSLFAVGFSPSTNDYKVVAVQVHVTDWGPPGFAVYGLSDGCWRRGKRSTWTMDFDVIKQLLSCSSIKDDCVSTKGAAHWLIGFKENFTDGFTHILSFDFDVEEFSFVELPCDGDGELLWFVFVLGESVAVLGVSPAYTCIWVMEDKDGRVKERRWKKWYSGDSTSEEYHFFKDRRDAKILSFKESGEFWMQLFCGNQTWYNIRSHKIRTMALPVYDIFIHVESLVLSTLHNIGCPNSDIFVVMKQRASRRWMILKENR